MTEIRLPTLRGSNPVGLFAALGALDVATRLLPEGEVRLRWTDEVDPSARLDGPLDVDHLIELCLRDVVRWRDSPVLAGPPDAGDPTGSDLTEVDDLKVGEADLRRWIEHVARRATPSDMTDLRLQSALIAEGGFAGSGNGSTDRVSKPTHFHFTAGRQLFLVMVRELRDAMSAEHLREALVGPWRYESELPVLGWDSRGERVYALSGPSPATVKKTGVPGAEWLAFLGLRFFPVTVQRAGPGRPAQLVTTGCTRGWKWGTFTWPLWARPITADVASGLLAHQGLESMTSTERRALGVHSLLRAPIRRTAQGGYGSFGAPEIRQ